MLVLPPERVPVTATETRYAAAVVALEQSGHHKNALIAYNALLKRWPDSLTGQMGRGNVAYALHDLETAEAAFRQAAQDHSDSAAAFNNLANVLGERNKLNDALAAAEKAVALGGPMLSATEATLEEIKQKIAAARAEEAARAQKTAVPAATPAPAPAAPAAKPKSTAREKKPAPAA
jgi:tetratricopeptide (TPR) repeat protein